MSVAYHSTKNFILGRLKKTFRLSEGLGEGQVSTSYLGFFQSSCRDRYKASIGEASKWIASFWGARGWVTCWNGKWTVYWFARNFLDL